MSQLMQQDKVSLEDGNILRHLTHQLMKSDSDPLVNAYITRLATHGKDKASIFSSMDELKQDFHKLKEQIMFDVYIPENVSTIHSPLIICV